jgi:aerobic carbon-monoxide dehydrogenase medium subunit
MIPASFEYTRVASVADAIEALKSDPSAKILAGGHSLIPAMKLRLSQPSKLVDISRIAELNFIRDRGKYIAIGATTTHGTIAAHKTTVHKLPLLAATAAMIGDIQVRNMGTIGGSIAHADPAADWPAVLLAAGATIVVQGPYGDKKIPANEFFTGFFSTKLEEGEIITEIRVPEPAVGTYRHAYAKFVQPASRFALVGCAVQFDLSNGVISNARVAYNGVGEFAFRDKAVEAALNGQKLTQATIENAASKAGAGDFVMSDTFASETYRRHLTKVYTKRALTACTA